MILFRTQNCLARIVALSLMLLCITHSSLRAEDATTNEWIKASAITSASLALTLGLRFVPTPNCYWCAMNSFDRTITRAWQVNNLPTARITSDIITFGVVPLLALAGVSLLTPNFDAALQDALIILSAAAATTAITEGIKISARRLRPEASFGYPHDVDEENRSFLSGHTSFSFSLLTSASILAFKRDSRFAPAFALLSAITATSVGISRIAAAKHWATDVLAGMTLGIAAGATMPLIIFDRTDHQKTAGFYVVPDPLISGVQFGMTL